MKNRIKWWRTSGLEKAECRGRDSNPHGGCPPENFKSFRFDSNYVKFQRLVSLKGTAI